MCLRAVEYSLLQCPIVREAHKLHEKCHNVLTPVTEHRKLLVLIAHVRCPSVPKGSLTSHEVVSVYRKTFLIRSLT